MRLLDSFPGLPAVDRLCVVGRRNRPVHYICDEQADWYPDIEDMRSKITDKTKAIVLNQS